LIVVVGPPVVVPGAIVTIFAVVVGANASKSIPEKSKGIEVVVDDDVAAAFGSTTVVTSGAVGTSDVLVVVVVEVVVVDVVVVDVVVVDVVVVVAGTRSG
jgi:hypothetical protein